VTWIGRYVRVGLLVLPTAGVALSEPVDARVCSVFRPYPCVYRPYHQVCSVFRPHACTPEPIYPFGEQLQLTIESQSASSEPSEPSTPHDLRTIRDVFAALRACWRPPSEDQAKPGTQLSVRMSFKRGGEIFGQPRMTYLTPGTPSNVRNAYWEAVMATFSRCTPLSFSKGLGGALAGRPFAIRFIDNRRQSGRSSSRSLLWPGAGVDVGFPASPVRPDAIEIV
jgi:hypothetical protein